MSDDRVMPKKAERADDVVVVGTKLHPLRDAYHSLLRMPWWAVLLTIASSFLGINAIFAVGYLASGGISGARSGAFSDAFFFSVQTMGTVGYGAMYPQSAGANVLVVAEAVVGLILTALATGIVFTRFSQSQARIIFSSHVCISPVNGVPTLALRTGNDRASTIFEARVRVAVIRTERTDEGVVFYKLHDLLLSRDRTPALTRSWTIMHAITETSLLAGATPESIVKDEIELVVTVVGTDDTSLQPVHARRRYVANEIVWGARHADVLSELADGTIQLDVGRFDAIVPTLPTDTFNYPRLALPESVEPS